MPLVQITITAASNVAGAQYYVPYNHPTCNITLKSIQFLGSVVANQVVTINSPVLSANAMMVNFISKKNTAEAYNSADLMDLDYDLGTLPLANQIPITLTNQTGALASPIHCILGFDITV